MYVLPQFEGLEEGKLEEFYYLIKQKFSSKIDLSLLKSVMEDFFNITINVSNSQEIGQE